MIFSHALTAECLSWGEYWAWAVLLLESSGLKEENTSFNHAHASGCVYWRYTKIAQGKEGNWGRWGSGSRDRETIWSLMSYSCCFLCLLWVFFLVLCLFLEPSRKSFSSLPVLALLPSIGLLSEPIHAILTENRPSNFKTTESIYHSYKGTQVKDQGTKQGAHLESVWLHLFWVEGMERQRERSEHNVLKWGKSIKY